MGYLEGQRERVGYDERRQRGRPRGRGGIESANKLICHVRPKRSGAWWLEANGNAYLVAGLAIDQSMTRLPNDQVARFVMK